MSDTSTPEFRESTNSPEPLGEKLQSEFDPIVTQEEFEKRVHNRVTRERAKYADYKDLQAKAARLAELESANKTEAEKNADRIRQLETELDGTRHEILRSAVAVAKGVPPHRITGETREELEASADEYKAEIAEAAKTERSKPVSLGRSGAIGTDQRLDPKERAAAALRAYRSGV